MLSQKTSQSDANKQINAITSRPFSTMDDNALLKILLDEVGPCRHRSFWKGAWVIGKWLLACIFIAVPAVWLFLKGWGWSVHLQQYVIGAIQNVYVGEWVGWAVKWGMRVTLYSLCPLVFSIHTFAYIIFHDLCHNSFFKSKLLNEICGSILGPICSWQSFAGWHILHNEHHHHAGNLEQAQYPYSDHGISDIFYSKVQYPFWHQTFLKLIVPYVGGVHYPWKMYDPSLYKGARQSKSWFSSHQWHILYSGIISIGVIMLWNMFLCYIFSATTLYSIIATVLFWYVAPMLIFYVGWLDNVFGHHFGENAMMMDIEKDNANVNIKWSLVRGVLMHTFDTDYDPNSWRSHIHIYFDNGIRTDHVAHHLDYSIPCYNLSQATRIMKRCLEELANGEYRELTDDAIQALRNEKTLDMDSDGYVSSKHRVSTEDSRYYSKRYEFILTDNQGEPVRDNRGRAIEYGAPLRTDVDGNKVEVIVEPFVNRKECNHKSNASDKKTYAYCVHAADGDLDLGNGVKAKAIAKENVIITQYNMRENPVDINAWKMMWVNFEWNTNELRFLSFEEVITRKLEGSSEWKKRWCFRMSRMLGMVG